MPEVLEEKICCFAAYPTSSYLDRKGFGVLLERHRWLKG